MKRLSPSTVLFLIGSALIVVSNIMALSGVALNRKDPVDARITLTERELSFSYRHFRENSGMALRLDWRVLDSDGSNIYATGRWGQPLWLDEKKLLALGFDGQTLQKYLEEENGNNKLPLPKKVFVVLELGGAAHAEAIARAEEALAKEENKETTDGDNDYIRDRVKDERDVYSRLFAIDAGLDPMDLRKQYPDRARFLILKGAVEPGIHYQDKMRTLSGQITNLSVESLNIPLRLRPVLDKILDQDKYGNSSFPPSRYSADLVVGSRFEPWIEAVHPMNDEK